MHTHTCIKRYFKCQGTRDAKPKWGTLQRPGQSRGAQAPGSAHGRGGRNGCARRPGAAQGIVRGPNYPNSMGRQENEGPRERSPGSPGTALLSYATLNPHTTEFNGSSRIAHCMKLAFVGSKIFLTCYKQNKTRRQLVA